MTASRRAGEHGARGGRTVYGMSGGGLGGGVIFVVAALLWAAVLVPAWLRRREFKAAERNALRLQRTLRVLAETSEVPQEVRVEATAREALAQEKLLRTAQRRQDAEREAQLASERAEQVRAEILAQQSQRKHQAMQRAAKLRRPVVRRARAIAALATVLGIAGVCVGAGLALAGSGTLLLLGASLLGAIGAGVLVLLAPGRAKVHPIAAENVEPPVAAAEPIAEPAEPETVSEDAAAAAHAAAQQVAAARISRARALARARAGQTNVPMENQTDSILLREARAQVERARGAVAAGGTTGPLAQDAERLAAEARRTAEAAAQADQRRADEAALEATVQRRAESNARAARLQAMGVIGDTSEGSLDLDAVFRRRRNAG